MFIHTYPTEDITVEYRIVPSSAKELQASLVPLGISQAISVVDSQRYHSVWWGQTSGLEQIYDSYCIN